MSNFFAFVKECEGKITWAVGVHPKTLWRGEAKTWDEARMHVAKLRERLIAEIGSGWTPTREPEIV